MNLNRIAKLNNLVTKDLKRKPTIILDPNPAQAYRIIGTATDLSMAIDTDRWPLPQHMVNYIEELNKTGLSTEEKVLKIYEELCMDYTYDDNILTYIKKNDDDTFYLPDYYGRDTDDYWKMNREHHNRRTCFEISRLLAKSISEMIRTSGNTKNYDTVILWDEAVTHYFVGLACDDYIVTFDLDDFTQIKDLTRVKTGLSVSGIRVLEDEKGFFSRALDKFNEGKPEEAKDHLQEKMDDQGVFPDEVEDEDITYLRYAAQILKEDYDMDSAGIFEYFKEIVDTKLGARSRKKVWKEVRKGMPDGIGARFTRCLVISVDDKDYIVDVTKDTPEEIFREFDPKEMEDPYDPIIPFSKMHRDWDDDPYDGR